jgi:hypothetical protein
VHNVLVEGSGQKFPAGQGDCDVDPNGQNLVATHAIHTVSAEDVHSVDLYDPTAHTAQAEHCSSTVIVGKRAPIGAKPTLRSLLGRLGPRTW